MRDDDTDTRPKGTRSFGVMINTKATGKKGSQERAAGENTQEGASLSDTGELTKEKEEERPLCFAARKDNKGKGGGTSVMFCGAKGDGASAGAQAESAE